MSDRDWMLLAVGLVAGYVIGRAHAQRLAADCACKASAQAQDPLAWLSAWQQG